MGAAALPLHPRARMVGETTRRALVHDARFRAALEECVETCQAAAVTMIALSVSTQGHGRRAQLHDGWRACHAAAAALDRIDALAREELVRELRACEVRSGAVGSAAGVGVDAAWSRCTKLARRCARLCGVLARWIEQGRPPDCATTEAATVRPRG